MSPKYLMVIAAAVTIVLTGLAAVLYTDSGEADPRLPQDPPSELTADHGDHELADLDFGQFAAVGFSKASDRIEEAVEFSPFALRLPEYVPDGLELERFALLSYGSGEATFDGYYTVEPTGGWRPAVHTWQSNRTYESGGPLNPGGQEGAFEVNGQTWNYWLLSYPQEDGSVREMWDAHASLADGTYVTVDIRIGENPDKAQREEALDELRKVLESLAPQTTR